MHSPKNLNLFINFFAKSWTTTSVIFYDGQQFQFSVSSLRTILLFTFFIFTYTFFRTTLPACLNIIAYVSSFLRK